MAARRNRSSSNYLGRLTLADLNRAADTDDDLLREIAAWNAMRDENQRDWDAVDDAWRLSHPDTSAPS